MTCRYSWLMPVSCSLRWWRVICTIDIAAAHWAMWARRGPADVLVGPHRARTKVAAPLSIVASRPAVRPVSAILHELCSASRSSRWRVAWTQGSLSRHGKNIFFALPAAAAAPPYFGVACGIEPSEQSRASMACSSRLFHLASSFRREDAAHPDLCGGRVLSSAVVLSGGDGVDVNVFFDLLFCIAIGLGVMGRRRGAGHVRNDRCSATWSCAGAWRVAGWIAVVACSSPCDRRAVGARRRSRTPSRPRRTSTPTPDDL